MSKVIFKTATAEAAAAARTTKSSFGNTSAFKDGTVFSVLPYDATLNWVQSDDTADAKPVLRVQAANGQIENLFLSSLVRDVQDFSSLTADDLSPNGTFNVLVRTVGQTAVNDEAWLQAIVLNLASRKIVARRGQVYKTKFGSKAKLLSWDIQ